MPQLPGRFRKVLIPVGPVPPKSGSRSLRCRRPSRISAGKHALSVPISAAGGPRSGMMSKICSICSLHLTACRRSRFSELAIKGDFSVPTFRRTGASCPGHNALLYAPGIFVRTRHGCSGKRTRGCSTPLTRPCTTSSPAGGTCYRNLPISLKKTTDSR